MCDAGEELFLLVYFCLCWVFIAGWAFSVVACGGLLELHWLLTAVTSLGVEYRLNSCGA